MLITKKCVDLLFPARCLGCGEFDTWVCDRCAKRISGTMQSVRGQLLFHRYLAHVYTLTNYRDPFVAQIVLAFKYQFAHDIGLRIGELMAEQLVRRHMLYPNIQFDAVVPIPLLPRRERWRGFNQSVILASAITSRCNWPLETALVRRIHLRELQTTLTARHRRQNILNAFSVMDPAKIVDKRILLVDDIITTGATCNECAKVLIRAGARDVWAVSFAQG